jgi:hypothetical protein
VSDVSDFKFSAARQIASWLLEKLETVHLFSVVFWNVGSRLQDYTYMADLLALNRLGAVEPGVALAQMAYREGPLHLARTVGLAHVAPGAETLPELYDRLERGILVRANGIIERKLFDAQARSILRDGQMLLLAEKGTEAGRR